MKIFGINFTTKKELKKQVAELKTENEILYAELDGVAEDFPFDMGQKVYDVALKNAQGRYTKTKPSREHCTITEVEVNEKNYFGLVKRLNNNDVFFNQEDAESYLDHVCK
jgi:hypothetical protein